MNKTINGQTQLKVALKTIDKLRADPASGMRNAALLSVAETLVPISGPEFRLPRAAFEIAAIHCELAKAAVADICSPRTVDDARGHIAQSAKFFQLAASMPDSQNIMIPTQAKERMATLHDEGYLNRNEVALRFELIQMAGGKKAGMVCQADSETAFWWRTQAAKEGYAVSQWKLGRMFAQGLGTQISYAKALQWMSQAEDNKAHLTYSQEGILREDIDEVLSLMSAADARRRAPKSRVSLLRVVR